MIKEYSCTYCGGKQSQTLYENIKDWEYGVEGDYSYKQCEDCAGVQLFPFPEIEDLVKAYNIDYHGYANSGSKGFLYKFLYNINTNFLIRSLKKFVPANARVLDVGCGAGEVLEIVRKMGASEVEGIDFNDKAMQMLDEKGIKGFKGTFDAYKKTDHYFDLIIMNNYLEHTLNPVSELKKARILLKKGGYLIGEVPGFDSYERKVFKQYWGGNHVPRHTYQFNQGFLKKLFLDTGFTRISIQHQLNTGHLALSVQNYFQKNVSNLHSNKKIKHGRSRFYYPLLLLFIPFNFLPVLTKKSGVTKFVAKV